MNRKNEFEAMLKELNHAAPELEGTLDRAYRKRRKQIIRPFAGLGACFAIFVLLVNCYAPVAHACSQVPVLRELAAAVTFSRSLRDAVENEYAQPMGISRTENEITAEIAYLIVDQKQVHIFHRLSSGRHTNLQAQIDILSADGSRLPSTAWSIKNQDAHSDGLQDLSIDFLDGDVPESLRLILRVYEAGQNPENTPPADPLYSASGVQQQASLAKFDFLLEFDPRYTAPGKIYPVNQTVDLGGQTITISRIEVYPTHMRIEISEDVDNTAWLKGLDFHIETDQGTTFLPVANGITAVGSGDTPSLVSYRADSIYFYEAKQLKLVITEAQWLNKDAQPIYVNLQTGETGELPQGVCFDSAKKQNQTWVLRFRAQWDSSTPMYQIFTHDYMDGDGKEYHINQSSSYWGEEDAQGNVTWFYDEFPLTGFPDDEVWLNPLFTHRWNGEVKIQVSLS